MTILRVIYYLFCLQAAYQNNTLGLPRVCPADSLGQINQKMIYHYLKHHHTPDRMVLAGVGVDHEELVQMAKQFFVTEPVWGNLKQGEKVEIDKSTSQYTGGLCTVSNQTVVLLHDFICLKKSDL